ncbi:uncharacterized protein N7483_010010 [Penicillium malachiteum]|uniref:uncharacterized protein n=1 Tax=Penicillium malachiteum TaxID=1324776 RepID=UPI002548FC37|nr:uncharacterized protein N7483_010010 [Penicillium malachiteum]KAJ5718928.1 hypothetical protein N7483_010010 [Penicillium malachiteum]
MVRQQPGLACEECRRRKARCDRVRPQCGVCSDSGRKCVFVDKRSPRGPKKGQLKELRSRVGNLSAIIENQLASQTRSNSVDSQILESVEASPEYEMPGDLRAYSAGASGLDADALQRSEFASSAERSISISDEQIDRRLSAVSAGYVPSTWSNDGVFSPSSNLYDLRPASAIDLIYFDRVNPMVPMINRDHYFTWVNRDNISPTRVCLRLAMRAVSAAMSSEFGEISEVLYLRTRQMLEIQEMQGSAGLPWMTRPRSPRNWIDYELIQAWILLAHYEFFRKFEQEALLTCGHAFTLLQLSGIFNVDMQTMQIGLVSSPPEYPTPRSFVPGPSPATQMTNGQNRSWVEVEEMRRTIWAAFVLDRLSSMLNHRPPMLQEEVIYARLPMPEADFQTGQRPVLMGFLSDVMSNNENYITLPPFSQCIALSSLFGRCISHRRLSQSVSPPGSEIESQGFWARHQWLATAAGAITKTRLQDQMPHDSKSAEPNYDTMIFFNHVLAYSTCVLLSETAEERPWQTLDDQMVSLTYKQTAYQAANEVVSLVQNLPQMAFIKMHVFLASAICIVARFLSAPTTQLVCSEGSGQESVKSLLFALRYLGGISNMARDILTKLEAEIALTMPASVQMAT